MTSKTATQPIAILSALAEEQAGVLEQLSTARCVTHAGRDFWLGELHGQSVVLALSRIGKVAAATTACALVSHFHARCVVLTGVAGGVGPSVRVGDVVLGTGFVQHDMDASPLFPRYEIPLTGVTVNTTDLLLTQHLQRACEQALPKLTYLGHHPDIHRGLIATGDKFVNGVDEVAALIRNLALQGHQVLAVEMEGAAVAQVCADYGIPFAAVRTISDRADDTAHVDFSVFVRDVASVYARNIVAALLQSL